MYLVNMSELKKDYTTPEQSKRLLELGIPIESANIVYYHTPDSLHDPYLITEKRQIENLKAGKGLPCWSVGRLIEIIKICSKPKEKPIMSEELLYCRDLVGMLVFILEGNRSVIDFSKLGELG